MMVRIVWMEIEFIRPHNLEFMIIILKKNHNQSISLHFILHKSFVLRSFREKKAITVSEK